MKKNLLLIIATVLSVQLLAQNTWTRKANFGGEGRHYAVGFSIGSKGYIGTGHRHDTEDDFWEYDPATDAWTQKANFGGGKRRMAVGFSIGEKGYIGTGYDYSFTPYSDFWEYDPTTNLWTRKADFGGGTRTQAVGFSIESKGYIGTGGGDGGYKNDFWEYDPLTDIWTRKADFGGEARYGAAGFSINGKGYLGTGNDYYYNNTKSDFWEYNPGTDTWTRKKDYGEGGVYEAVGFSIGNKGYIGMGSYNNSPQNFYEYDPVTDRWVPAGNIPIGRYSAVGFSIGDRGYVGTGDGGFYAGFLNDFWTFGPCNSSGDPSVFGNNSWNVYVWNEGDGTLTGSAWQNNYFGYYIDNAVSFDTRNKWPVYGSPSAADTYHGCYAGPDHHSWSAKRQGFSCGKYRISVAGHEGAAQLFIDGVKVWEHDSCCDTHDSVWEGYLKGDSKIEFRGTEGTGLSYGAISISIVRPEITSNSYPTVCTGTSVTLSAAGTGNTYLWSTGETTQSITVSQAGQYTVQMTDDVCGTQLISLPFTVSELVAPGTNPSGDVILGTGNGSNTIEATGYPLSDW